jgi:DNA-binding transcriptional regulator YiaG
MARHTPDRPPCDHFLEFSPEVAARCPSGPYHALSVRKKLVHFPARRWHGERVTELRVCRRQLGLSQSELANALRVPRNSLRMWDSGLRPTPDGMLERARVVAAEAVREQQPLTLPALAKQLKRAPPHASSSRANWTPRSALLAAIGVWSPATVLNTRRRKSISANVYYKRYGGQPAGCFEVPARGPNRCRRHLRELRRRLRISQRDLAELVGASNKAVVYQWESGKRRPSPVFWDRVLALTQQAHRLGPSVKIE